MPDKMDFIPTTLDESLEREEALICETLVREIGRAGRWSAVLEGFDALVHVRHMAASLHKEARMFAKSRQPDDRSRPDEEG